MKTALSVLAMAAASTALPASYVEMNEGLLWANFKQTYGKQYSGEDEWARRAVFKKNMLKAAHMEALSKTARFGANQFADLTEEEFKARHSLKVPSAPHVADIFSATDVLKAKADSVDWRKEGRVTHVGNEGTCGAPWAFSVTGVIEGAWSADHTLTPLSNEELVACDTLDQGCSGGLMKNTYDWLLQNKSGSIVTEAAYPYVSGDEKYHPCRWTKDMEIGATITGYKFLPKNEDQIAAWVLANGPVSVAVDATHWQLYTSGVMDNCQGKSLDHAALIVGVTPTEWVVKNMWGTTWGEGGYIRLARGSNQCLLDNYASYVTV